MSVNGKAKGCSFERDICKKLSLWWTNQQSDDIFWRTASSGGRATQRKKQEKETFGQNSDIQATNPDGQPFVDLFCIECKRGYGKWDLLEFLDGGKTTPEILSFSNQVMEDCEKGQYPVIIFKRDRKKACIAISAIGLYEAQDTLFSLGVRIHQGLTLNLNNFNYFVFELDLFFAGFIPNNFYYGYVQPEIKSNDEEVEELREQLQKGKEKKVEEETK